MCSIIILQDWIKRCNELLFDERENETLMYKNISLYLYQNSHYEDLSVELFEIEARRKQIYKLINSLADLSHLDEKLLNELYSLLNREKSILSDLLRATLHSEVELQTISTINKK
jgi:hypothetical protein